MVTYESVRLHTGTVLYDTGTVRCDSGTVRYATGKGTNSLKELLFSSDNFNSFRVLIELKVTLN